MPTCRAAGACAAGFSLVEVLVAVLLLALGMVGGAALQLSALRARHESAMLSSATQVAAAMAERMRGNPLQMRLSDAANGYLNVFYDAADGAAPPVPARFCYAGAGCTSAQLASFDLYELKQQVRESFPAGRLAICRDTRAWNSAAQGMDWACDGTAAAPVVIKLGWRGRDLDGNGLQSAARPAGPRVVLALPRAAP